MSLEIDQPINVNLINWKQCCLQPNQVYLFDPEMAIPSNSSHQCGMYFNNANNFNSSNLQDPVFNSNCYQISDNSSGNSISTINEPQNEDIPYQYMTGREVNEGLEVLEILYNNNSHNHSDEPDFIDVTNLTENVDIETDNDVLNISDDDDDVIFVGEYKKNGISKSNHINSEIDINLLIDPDDNSQPRRNPVRKVRSTKTSKDLEKYVYFEEDFAFLEQQDELDEMNRKMTSYIKKQNSPDSLKKWPVNVHERPEFNEETKQLERFDYSIRKIKEAIPKKKKKPKFETVPKPAKKKKYIPKRRKLQRAVVEKKVPFSELSDIINSTFNLVKTFYKNSEEYGELIKRSKVSENADGDIKENINKWNLLRTQALLSCICNNLEHDRLLNSFKLIDIQEDDTE